MAEGPSVDVPAGVWIKCGVVIAVAGLVVVVIYKPPADWLNWRAWASAMVGLAAICSFVARRDLGSV